MSNRPQLTVIDTPQGIEELTEYVKQFEYVAYDCETTGLTQSHEVIGLSVCCEEGRAYYVILRLFTPSDGSLSAVGGCEEPIQDLLQVLLTKQVICHNSIFDCMMAESYFGVRLIDALHTDTMIMAHLLNENRRIGLKELGKELFGEDAATEQKEMKESVLANGGSLTKDNYEMWKCDPYILGKYGAKDAWLTYKLFLTLVPELYDQGLDKFFYEDESMPLLKGPTYELNTTGCMVDQPALLSLKKTLEAEIAEARDFIYQEIGSLIKDKYPGTNKKNTFNIGSSQQLSWLCFGALGLEFGTLTKEGKTVCRALGLKIPYHASAKRDFIATCERTKGNMYEPEGIVNGKKKRAKLVKDPWAYIAADKESLKKHAHKYKWIEKYLDYQKKTKLLTTYVDGLRARLQYGVMRPSFLQHGTTSGRYSSRNPNFQNLPRDDKRVKSVIVARPGKSLVGADYSQLEPRVFAYYSQDQRLMEVFSGSNTNNGRIGNSGDKTDFYSVIGMAVYGKYDCTPHKDGENAFGVKYKRLRDLSKVIALASTYGATSFKLSSTTGKTAAETQADIDEYFERFPGVRQMMLDAHALVKKQGWVENLYGRKRRIPEAKRIPKGLAHDELPYEGRKMLNLAVNHRIQSTGASIVNRAAIALYNNLKTAGINAKFVVQVHDSLVIECDAQDAENVSLLMQDAMENTIQLPGVPLEAIPKIGTSLADV